MASIRSDSSSNYWHKITILDKRLITSLQKMRLAGASSMATEARFLARIIVNYFIGIYLSEVSTEDVVVRTLGSRCVLATLRRQPNDRSLQTLAIVNVIYSSGGSAAGTIVPTFFRCCRAVRAVRADWRLVHDLVMRLEVITCLSHGLLRQKIWTLLWLFEWPCGREWTYASVIFCCCCLHDILLLVLYELVGMLRSDASRL